MTRETIEIARALNERGSHMVQAAIPDMNEVDRMEVDRTRALFTDSPALWMRVVALAAALHSEGMDSHLNSIGLSAALAGVEEVVSAGVILPNCAV
jgi:predicted phage tail protein